MSLIKCDECGRMISDKSQFCPQCGYPTPRQSALQSADESAEAVDQDIRQANHRHKVWAYVAVVVAVAAIIGVCYFAGSPSAGDEEVDEIAEPAVAEAVAAPDTIDADTTAAITTVSAPVAPAPSAQPAATAPKPAAAPKAEAAPEPPLPVDDKPLEPAPAPATTPAPESD